MLSKNFDLNKFLFWILYLISLVSLSIFASTDNSVTLSYSGECLMSGVGWIILGDEEIDYMRDVNKFKR